jgi:nanoRNase/pAp phosphatase (c-di-AMP/oligoRNAs hydrolase)
MGAAERRLSDGAGEPAWHGLAALLEGHRGERHVIVLQEYPDPDAISSAMAHQLISRQYDIRADIVHEGRVSHQENLALVKLMGVELTRAREGFDPNLYHGAVFLDNQGTTAREIVALLRQAQVPVLAVIDHHEPQGMLQPSFAEVLNIGATASIYGCYFQQGIMHLDPEDDQHVRVATALMHGIQSDTDDFIRATEQDFSAAAHLCRFRDVGLLEQIMTQARSPQTMEVIVRALQQRTVVEGVSVVGVGYVQAEDRDAIPQAADFLLTEENVHTSIAFGVVEEAEGEPNMVGSLRTSKLTFDPDKFIKEAFGQDKDGGYFGGGRRTAAAFEIPLDVLDGSRGDADRQQAWLAYEAQVRHQLFAQLGISEESPRPD